MRDSLRDNNDRLRLIAATLKSTMNFYKPHTIDEIVIILLQAEDRVLAEINDFMPWDIHETPKA